MSPLEAIARWLEAQDLDTQLEVAALRHSCSSGNVPILYVVRRTSSKLFNAG
ncbi:hypothetical protein ACVWZM_004528 [Bradyrhizobium sp. USDA 4501]